MRLRYKIILFVVLLALPILLRLGWYYRGLYQSPTISEVDTSQVMADLSTYQRYEDQPSAGDGHVVVDISHANRLQMNDLDPLHDRLSARGVTVESYDGENGSLAELLKNATALIVIAPAEEFGDEAELEAIKAFVDDGGRLLLAADPTRPAQDSDFDWENFELIPRISAIPATNSLANAFDISFFAEHVYNVEENEGNFRNVCFSNFDEGHELTEGLEEVVFFAAHSMRSNGTPLIVGDKNTLSPVRAGERDLTVATLTEDGNVLAIGDVTFMTAPYHTVSDNDRFLSNIADWLAVDGRDRSQIDDFPLLFTQPVDLVQASGNLLDPRLVTYGHELQALFEEVDVPLELALLTSNPYSPIAVPEPPAEEIVEGEESQELEFAAEDEPLLELPDLLVPGHDALLVGVFDELDVTVQRYLSQTIGISITIVVTDAVEGEAVEDATASEEEAAEEPAAEEPEEASPPEEEVTPDEEAPPEEASPPDTTDKFLGTAAGGKVQAGSREPIAALQDPDIGDVPQGEIGLNETVEGELAAGEIHSWIFASGPATIDIVLTPGENMDAILVLLGPDDEEVDFADSGLSGEVEELLGVEIPDDGQYKILLTDWFGGAGAYTLSVTGSSSGEEPTGEEEPATGEEPIAEEEPAPEEEPVVEEEPPAGEEPAAASQMIEGAPAGTITIPEIGTFAMEGLTLFIIDRQSDRLVVMVLAESGEMVFNALDRLAANDFSDCIESEDVILCSTGVAVETYGLDATLKQPESSAPAAEEETPEE